MKQIYYNLLIWCCLLNVILFGIYKYSNEIKLCIVSNNEFNKENVTIIKVSNYTHFELDNLKKYIILDIVYETLDHEIKYNDIEIFDDNEDCESVLKLEMNHIIQRYVNRQQDYKIITKHPLKFIKLFEFLLFIWIMSLIAGNVGLFAIGVAEICSTNNDKNNNDVNKKTN